MSQIDREEDVISEATTANSITESLKLVPVGESIRYRKRAQAAEKEAEDIAKELAEVQSQNSRIAAELSEIESEQKLTQKLVAAGCVDLEASLLLAKVRMKGADGDDINNVIGQLKKEKQYLFNSVSGPAASIRTSPAKEIGQTSYTVLSRAAKKAAATGNRTDMQEYLKLLRRCT